MPKLPIRLADVKMFLELAQEGLKGIGFPGVEALAGVPLKLIGYFETVSGNKSDLEELASSLELLQRTVIGPIDAAQERGHVYVPELGERLRRLNKRLQELDDNLASFVTLGLWKSFRSKDDISAVLRQTNRDLARAVSRFQLGGQITIELKLWELAAERLLGTLHPVNARFDATEKQPCLPSTRTTLLDTLRSDIQLSPSTFVCLYGSPGTGKSAVAKTIATELHHDGLLAASYFFDKRGGTAGNVSLADFISTLVFQLARFSYDFHAALARQLEKDPLLADATADVRLRELLINPLRSLPTFGRTRRRWVVVLDALDECGDGQHQQRLMHLLRECAKLEHHLVFFLTCRPEADITRVIQEKNMARSTATHSMDKQNRTETANDIQVYLQAKLCEGQRSDSSSFEPSPQNIDDLTTSCGGLFEIAAVRVRQLLKRSKHIPLEEAFLAVLHEARCSSAARSPLHDTYTSILATVYDIPDDPKLQAMVLMRYRSLVGSLVGVREPLALEPLADLVGISGAEARKALEPLGSVIDVPEHGGPVHVYHASFLEYLTSDPTIHHKDHPHKPSYLLGRIKCDEFLATRSLLIMNTSLRRNILNLRDIPTFNSEIPHLKERLLGHVPLRLRYACLNWAHHLQATDQATVASECRGLLVRWCENKIPFYFETLSLLGGMESVAVLFEKAQTWTKGARKLAKVAALLNDSFRVAQMFHPALAQSSRAIYSSALPFMPSCALRTQYSHLVVEEASVIHGRPPAWSSLEWTRRSDALRCAFSPNGQHVVSGSYAGHIVVYSSTTGTTELMFEIPAEGEYAREVTAVAFSPDGLHIVSGSGDNNVHILSAVTGDQARKLKGHTQQVSSVAFSPDGAYIVSGSADTTVRIWSVATGEQRQKLQGHAMEVVSVAFSPDGGDVFSGSADQTVRIWSAVTGEPKRVLVGHGGATYAVAFSRDGSKAVTGSRDHLVRLWALQTGDLTLVLRGHANFVTSVAFSPDGGHIVSGSSDGTARIWSVTGDLEQMFAEHDMLLPVASVAYSPDGSRIVSISGQDTMRMRSATTRGNGGVTDREYGGTVGRLVFSPDGARIASLSSDGVLCIWSVVSGQLERVLGRTYTGLDWETLQFSTDSRTVRGMNSYGFKDELHWDVATGAVLNFSLKSQYFPQFFQEQEYFPQFEDQELEDDVRVHDEWFTVDGREMWLPGAFAWHNSWCLSGDLFATTWGINDGILIIRLPWRQQHKFKPAS